MTLDITEDWLREKILDKKCMSEMAEMLDCDKYQIKHAITKYKLNDFYHDNIGNNALQMPKFRFKNPELKKRMEMFGKLYNVID